MRKEQPNKQCQKGPQEREIVDLLFDALVCLEDKLLTLQTLDEFDMEILAIIAPALNAARGVRKSHSAEMEVHK